jgi:competence protein ComEC
VELAEARIEVLWPPAPAPPGDENDRSLVVRLCRPDGTIIVTADISRRIEAQLAVSSPLGCDVLVAPHHGSKTSTSATLLDATRAGVVLIPAGPANTHGHPHPDVLRRLATRRTPFRYPARDSWCGAHPVDGSWRPWP